MNYQEFTAKKDALAYFMDFCRTLPFLSERRMAVLWEADHLAADDKKTLLAWVEGGDPSAVVVLVSEESNARKNDFLLGLSRKTKTLTFHPPFEKDLPEWVQTRAKAKGMSIDRQAVPLLLERTGRELSALDMALEELSLFAHGASSITLKHVEGLLGKSVQEDVFLLTDHVLEKNASACLRTLQGLLREGVRAHEIVAVMAGQFERLHRAVDALAEKRPAQEIGATLKIHPFFQEKFMRQAGRLTPARMRGILKELLDCDEAIKTGRMGDAMALERLVLRLCLADTA